MKWFDKTLMDAVHSSEWLALIKDIDKHVYSDQQDTNVHELTDHELGSMIQKYIKSMGPGSRYHCMLSKLSQLLNMNLHRSLQYHISLKHSTSQLHTEIPDETLSRKRWDGGIFEQSPQYDSSIYSSKSDYITMEVNETLISLLESHTEFLSKLSSRFLNQSLQSSYFRRRVWNIVLLSRCKSQKDMIRQMVHSFTPDRDEYIMHSCCDFLKSTCMSSMKDSVGCLYAMTYLSKFCQTLMNTSDKVKPHYIKLVAVLVLAVKDYLPRNQPANSETICGLAQELLALLSVLPSYITQLSPIWFACKSYNRSNIMKKSEKSKLYETEESKKIDFSRSVLKHLHNIDPNIAISIVKEVLLIKNVDIITNVTTEVDICSEVFYDFVQPIIEPIFSGYLSSSTLLYIWDQVIFCIGGMEPVESSVNYTLSCFLATFIFLCWIRFRNGDILQSHESSLPQNEQMNEASEQKGKFSSFSRCFQLVGPKLHEDDFKFIIKKHFFMDMFCLLTGTTKSSTEASALSNDELYPNKRIEQRLLRYTELKKLQATENDLTNLKNELESYKQNYRKRQMKFHFVSKLSVKMKSENHIYQLWLKNLWSKEEIYLNKRKVIIPVEK
ncbi:unnamed protein product [Heterobilharzia americana]|nr:unnamed protein product [Heterobilharzia americana]